jgi:hypothetical protein
MKTSAVGRYGDIPFLRTRLKTPITDCRLGFFLIGILDLRSTESINLMKRLRFIPVVTNIFRKYRLNTSNEAAVAARRLELAKERAEALARAGKISRYSAAYQDLILPYKDAVDIASDYKRGSGGR